MRAYRGNKKLTASSKRDRMSKTVYITGKTGLGHIMVDIGVCKTLKEAGHCYEAMTAGINAWLRAMTKSLPKNLHVKLKLLDAFSVNVCWLDRSRRNRPDKPGIFIIVSGEARSNLRRMRLTEYAKWADQLRAQGIDPKEFVKTHRGIY